VPLHAHHDGASRRPEPPDPIECLTQQAPGSEQRTELLEPLVAKRPADERPPPDSLPSREDDRPWARRIHIPFRARSLHARSADARDVPSVAIEDETGMRRA